MVRYGAIREVIAVPAAHWSFAKSADLNHEINGLAETAKFWRLRDLDYARDGFLHPSPSRNPRRVRLIEELIVTLELSPGARVTEAA